MAEKRDTGVRKFLKRLRYVLCGEAYRDRFGRGPAVEAEALYKILYDQYHDLNDSGSFAAQKTREAFERQWSELPEGRLLLSDGKFRNDLPRIICEEELLLSADWFKGKRVLDAGCGNGRWAYGLAQLGAHVTAVDTTEKAVEETRQALAAFDVEKQFLVSSLEGLPDTLGDVKFDLVFCWGVLHHCQSFNRAFQVTTSLVADGGIFYTYLYGRETLPYAEDIQRFKERVYFNTLASDEERAAFLLRKAGGDSSSIHNVHDIYAPLINRRFEFADIRERLKDEGFSDVVRTVDHSELFVRGVKGQPSSDLLDSFLEKQPGPYWFERH